MGGRLCSNWNLFTRAEYNNIYLEVYRGCHHSHGLGVVPEHLVRVHGSIPPLDQLLQLGQATVADLLGQEVVFGDLKRNKIVNTRPLSLNMVTYHRRNHGSDFVQQLSVLSLLLEDVHLLAGL